MEYQSNAHKNRDKAVPAEPKEPKNLEKVIEGKVIQRKKPLGRRMTEVFIGGDTKTVSQYVIFEVMVPATKDMIWDIISSGTERMLFGEVRGSSNRRRGGRDIGRIAYDKMSERSQSNRYRNSDRDVPTTTLSRRARAKFDFDELVLEHRVDAEEVIIRLEGLIEQYDEASVSDLYSILGITADFTDEKWGWTDMQGAGVRRVAGGGYRLVLPEPEALTKN